MYVSVTSFKVKGFWAHALFQLHAFSSFRQARHSLGILHSQVFSPGKSVYNTLTHWESKAHMLQFRSSGAHLKAMKLSAKMGKGITTGWETSHKIGRQEALQRLQAEQGSLI